METTTYVGGIYEKNAHSSDTEYRNYVYAGGQAVAVLIRKDNNPNNLRYFVYDHQGSIDTILNNSGGVHLHQSFAAFGARRDPADWTEPLPPTPAILLTTRTNHHTSGFSRERLVLAIFEF